MKAVRLRTEYLENPVGVDFLTPRLFWNDEEGIRQTAYEIVCKNEAGEILWESSAVKSASMHADYAGKPLKSRDLVKWQVRLYDEKGTPGPWSEEASFELGLLSSSDWKARWITGNYRVDPKKRYPVDAFRKSFRCKNVSKARLYITACGLYEASLNGRKCGDFVLAPGITDYKKRIQYQTIDVTELLQEGENTLDILLADGWYRGGCGAFGLRNQYGTETAVLAQLELTETDGSRTMICTDESFLWSNDGPILFADNKDGESVDARKESSFTGHAKLTQRSVVPTASDNVRLTEHERLQPGVITTPSGKTVLDFKQNIAGYLEFHVQAKAGDRIRIRCGELIDKSGELTLSNIQTDRKGVKSPLQEIVYICKEGENRYKTRFAIFGFQYAEVETEVPFSADQFTAIAVYSAMEETLAFDSSNELLNRFVSCTRWSTKNNSADLPTDCPTRERHGWTGDAQIFFGTAAYLFDYAAFSKKFLRDMYDWQKKNGCLPQIVPEGGVDFYMRPMDGSVGWADAGIIIPWHFYLRYGDERILITLYERMKRYAEFMIRRCGKRGFFAKPQHLQGEARKYLVNKGQSYGEWAEPDDVHHGHWTDQATPHPEVSTAYTAYMMDLMEKIAKLLGKDEDASEYRRVSEGCRLAYRELVKKPEFSLDTDRQAQLVRPLYMNLLDEGQTEFAKKRLLQAVKNYRYRVGTGFLSTPLILDVLSGLDLDAAYRMLENEELPGWLFMPKAGATTVWENWEGTTSDTYVASLNHYSKGAVLEWVFGAMCGVQMGGENHFVIAPRPGGHFTHASLSYDSIYGRVSSGWKKVGEKTTYSVTIPANCTAKLILPDGRTEELSAGSYNF